MAIWNRLGNLSAAVALSVVLITTLSAGSHQVSPGAPNRAQVVLLGTGNPLRIQTARDLRQPSVNGTPYLVDFGAGVVRRAKSALVDRGIAALDPVNCERSS